MQTQITLLVDNKAEAGLDFEHGLSIFIEHQGKRILFDNGQDSSVLFHNAEELNISLVDLDYIILSHGHFDHSGNLNTLLRTNPNALFYAHPDCLQLRYSLHANKPPRLISIKKEDIEAINNFPSAQKNFISKATEVLPNLWLTGEIPRLNDIEDTGGPFFLDKDKNEADHIHDDMSLWIKTEKGLTLVCGCCHSGIINTIEQIKTLTNQEKIKTMIGGLHLVNSDQRRLDATTLYLNKQHIENIYPGHCTGDKAMALLQERCTANVQIAKAGLKLTL